MFARDLTDSRRPSSSARAKLRAAARIALVLALVWGSVSATSTRALCGAASGGAAVPSVSFVTTASSAGEGAGQRLVEVRLSAAATGPVSVPLTTGGTATLGSDFVLPTNPLVIPVGATSAFVLLDLVQDNLYEGDEFVRLGLGAPTGATLGAGSLHTLMIVDDDPRPSVAFTTGRRVVAEAAGSFTVRVAQSAVSGRDTIVPLALSGPASGPGDIVAPANPVVIPAGQLFRDVSVGLVVDRVGEAGEFVTFRIVPPVDGATIGALDELTVAIDDGNAAPILQPPALGASPSALVFPQTSVGSSAGVRQLQITNVHTAPIPFLGLAPASGTTVGFEVRYPGLTLPVVLAPGQSISVDVEFVPLTPGPRLARFAVLQGLGGIPPREVTFSGEVLGSPGFEIVMNAAPTPYTMPDRTFWSADFGAVSSEGYLASFAPVAGTSDDALYHTSRWGQTIEYRFQVPNGLYEFGFRAWEPVHSSAGARVFDVLLEGQVAFDDVDLFALAGPATAWVSPKQQIQVSDGALDVRFEASVARALVSALEVRSVPILSTPTPQLQFGTVEQGHFGQLDLRIENAGLAPARLTSVQIVPGASGPATEFAVEIGSAVLTGSPITASLAVDLTVAPGQALVLPVVFTPTEHRDNDLVVSLNFAHGEMLNFAVFGTGGANAGWGFLHPVIDRDPLVVIDYDGNGSELVSYLGNESHTHEPGKALSAFEWRLNGQVVGTTVDTPIQLPLGQSFVSLKISDNNSPPSTATDTRPVSVYPAGAVPGLLAKYYDGSVLGEVHLLDNVPLAANFVARQVGLHTDQIGLAVGNSPFSGDVMVQWLANFTLSAPVTLTLTATGGDGRRVFVDGQLATGPLALAAGVHALDVRFAVSDVDDLPLTLAVSASGQSITGFENRLTHSEGALRPVIHSMPTQGIELGGNDIVIEGFGFFPKSQVVVNWGSTTIPSSQFVAFSAERIHVISPPGSGNVDVRVTTPNGTSNAFTFHYSISGPVPIRWNVLNNQAVAVNAPTRTVWGPDGRLWVSLLDGSLRAITYDENWNATGVQYYTGILGATNKDILGLAFNPFDAYDPQNPASLIVYIAHGDHYQTAASSFMGPSAFTGQVSSLRGPLFDMATPVVTGLPTSNHDHSINGIAFDDNGDLLITCGGNTNAGVGSALMGNLPESPFSGAILKAFTSRPTFDGTVTFLDRQSLLPVTDQRFAESSFPAPTCQVEVYAAGMRNAFDLVLHSNGNIYATDNGPNANYGPASTGMTTQGTGPDPDSPDELLLIERGNYYGHPNRSRGLDDPRQAVYYDAYAPSLAHRFTQRIAHVDSSTNGIDEYRATTFGSQLRGQLLVMKHGAGMRFFQLTPDGRSVVQPLGMPTAPFNGGLDIAVAPGGAIATTDYWNGAIRMQVPDDVAAVGMTPYDVFPARGVHTGGARFEIGGVGFGNLASTSVTFRGVPAVLTSVTSKRIKGIIPALPSAAIGFVDVVVNSAGSSLTIPNGFKALPAQPGLAAGFWSASAPLPQALAEVAAAEVDGMLYVWGQGDPRTLRFDLINGTWSSNFAQRPFAGNHHGCEVWNGRIYLIGGLDGGSPGRVQIYDPVANAWSLGAPMPWAGGSVSTALIGDRIYVAGGIVGSSTVGNVAWYSPAQDAWTSLPSMPLPVNHAAAATDGARFYIFGGRQGGNTAQPGFSNVQVFDPVTATWRTSQAGQLAPMPLPRGGTGRAVWYRGEFYVMGGESNTAVYSEVQAYNPITNTWRRDAALPTARHGHYPVVFQDRVFVLGGGLNFGFGVSTVVEVFKRP
ncbi:MAG: kelch repeat-containing protein [Planctomycetota bacterium]